MPSSMNGMNGLPALAGAAADREEPAPIIGSRPCRISRPLRALAAHVGRWGRAWVVDLYAARRKLPLGAPLDATVAHVVVEAPWSSQVVHSYSLICVHLREAPYFGRPVVRYLEGATHEVSLIAIHPEADRAAMLAGPTDPDSWLSPAVFAAQIVASSDDAARARVMHAVELICAGSLSPHPTHARSWAALFGDNMLRRAAPEGER